MTPRERARGRLTRRVSGQDLAVPLEVRVVPLPTVAVEPNAPLLLRLVREPFGLDPGRAVRVPDATQPRVACDPPRAPPRPFARARRAAEER